MKDITYPRIRKTDGGIIYITELYKKYEFDVEEDWEYIEKECMNENDTIFLKAIFNGLKRLSAINDWKLEDIEIHSVARQAIERYTENEKRVLRVSREVALYIKGVELDEQQWT